MNLKKLLLILSLGLISFNTKALEGINYSEQEHFEKAELVYKGKVKSIKESELMKCFR